MITKLGQALDVVRPERLGSRAKSVKFTKMTKVPFTNNYVKFPRGAAALAGAGVLGLGLLAYHKHLKAHKH